MKDTKLQEILQQLEIARYEDFQKEKTIALQLLNEALQCQHIDAESYAYCYLLDSCIAMEDTLEARYYMIHALNMCEQTKNQKIQVFTYHLCGLYYYFNFDEHSALDYYCKALEIGKQCGEDKLTASILNNIATLFHNRYDLENALSYYQMAFDLITPFHDERSQRIKFIILSNMLTIEKKQGNSQQARIYLEKARAYQHLYPTLFLGGEVLVAFSEGNEAEAITYLDQMFHSYQISRTSFQQHFETFDEILPIAISLNDKERTKQILMILCETCNSSNANQMLLIQQHFIEYCEAFSTKYNLDMLYKDYFHLSMKANRENDRLRSQSYHEKLLLNDLMKQNKILKKKAGYDEVTQLKNRHSYQTDIKDILNHEEVHHIGIMMCDIDNFKEYNDRYGHLYGDQVIKVIADLLLAHTDEKIIPYRFGGDEYLCLFINKTKQEMLHYLETIFSQLRTSHHDFQLSAGFICRSCDAFQDINDLIACADGALYEAKNSGKNKYVDFDEQEVV